jgi:hypothetical protein
VDELSNETGQPVGFEKWDRALNKLSPSDSPASAAGPLPARAFGIHEHSDPKKIAEEAGFKQGCFVYERSGGKSSADLFYTIESIGEVTVLKQTCPYNDQVISINVHTVSQLLKDWNTSADGPFKLSSGETRCTSAIQLDSLRASLYHSIVEAGADVTPGLQFYRKPDVVVTGEKFAKGSLVLAPLAPLLNITAKKTSSTFSLGVFNEKEMFVIPPTRIGSNTTLEKYTAEASLAAFWWVINDTTEEDDDVNMEIVSKRFGGKMINVIQNTKLIPKYTRLRMKKEEREEKRPLSNVISAVSQSREEAPPPKKKK